MGAWETQMRKGVVELAVLAILARGESYGYRILEQLHRRDGLELTESTVYPALTRMAREGLLAIRTQPSPSGPPRRYYRLTPSGAKRLGQMADSWRALAGSLSDLLTLKEGATPP